jgi:hypothetical protein
MPFAMNSNDKLEPEQLTTVIERPEPLDPKRLKRTPVMSKVSWLLVAGLIGCGGFVIGAKSQEESAPATGAFPRLGAGAGGGAPSLPAGFDPSVLLATLEGGGGKTKDLPAATTSAGEIILISGGKIYVKLPDGTNKAVSVTSGTSVSTASVADPDSLKVGQMVLVDGRPEENGVIAANAVVVQPD